MKNSHEHGHREGQEPSGNGCLSLLLQKDLNMQMEKRQTWGYNSPTLRFKSCEGTDLLCANGMPNTLGKRKDENKL